MAGRCNLWAGLLDLGLEAGLVQTRRVLVWVWGCSSDNLEQVDLGPLRNPKSHRQQRFQGGFWGA